MQIIKMPFGKSYKSLQLPDSNGVKYSVLRAAKSKPIANISNALNTALDKPIGSKPFDRIFTKPNDRVTIVIPDKTRRCQSDRVLDVLVKRLQKLGIKPDAITVILARGIHPAHSSAEIKRIVGNSIFSSIRIIDHDAHDCSQLVHIGTTCRGTEVEINRYAAEADKLITVGVVQYHYYAGFSGGRKLIVPGIASSDTITQNHSLVLHRPPRQGKNPDACLGKLDGNPVNEDMIESAKMAGVDLSINLVVNHHEEIIRIFCGDIIKAHRAGCDFLDRSGKVRLRKPVDCVIASAGGHPTDINFIQTHKTLEHSSRALKQNGTMIILSECPEGVGSDVFTEWSKDGNPERMMKRLQTGFAVSGHTALCSLIKAKRFDIYFYSRLKPDIVKMMQFRPVKDIQPLINTVMARLPRGGRVLVLPEGYSLVPYI